MTVTEPTCTKNGLKQAVCDVCHNVIEEEVIVATGHRFVNGICAECGVKEGAEIPKQINVMEIESGKQYALAFNGTTGLFGLTRTESGIEAVKAASQTGWDDNQTWTITEEDGGYTISANVNGETMYLARTSAFTGSGYQIGLEKERFVWSVTADQEMHSLRFSAHSGFSTYYLRYYSESTGWQACSRSAGLKVYEVNK